MGVAMFNQRKLSCDNLLSDNVSQFCEHSKDLAEMHKIANAYPVSTQYKESLENIRKATTFKELMHATKIFENINQLDGFKRNVKSVFSGFLNPDDNFSSYANCFRKHVEQKFNEINMKTKSSHDHRFAPTKY